MLSHNKNNAKRILLAGGGTGGSVAPLLAIAEEFFNPPSSPLKGESPLNAPLVKGGWGVKFLWLGTKKGPEKEMVASAALSTGEKAGIKFEAIVNGKLRRYFSFKNFIAPFLILIGFFQSFFIILKWRPNLVITAGGFVGVPVVWAAWILRVPILAHQQDARPGLANKLMAPLARIITVTFEKSLKDYGRKAIWTGNPIRRSLITHNMQHITYNKKAPLIRGGGRLDKNLPTLLVIGGGTGAMAINKLIWQSLNELTKFCNIIHITGRNKILPRTLGAGGICPPDKGGKGGYKYFEFLNSEQMAESYAVSDIVVSRAGMGVLTELSYLGKPAILIPIPASHQEENAEIFRQKKATIVLNQKGLTSEIFSANIKKLLEDERLRVELSRNISEIMKGGANEEMVKIIYKLLK